MQGTAGDQNPFALYTNAENWLVVDVPSPRLGAPYAAAAHPVLMQWYVPGIGLATGLWLPAEWPLETRSYHIATFIASDILRQLAWSQPENIHAALQVQVHRQQAAEKLAHRLLVARPWLDAYIIRHGVSPATLRHAAQLLTVPYESVEYMIQATPDALANKVHAFIQAKTGYPWFLQPAIRDQYDRSKW